jgi:hypothetical protein
VNAKLPLDLLDPTIGSMEPGQVSFAVPWALIVDPEMNLWAQSGFGVEPAPGGTTTMRVERTLTGVRISGGVHRYRITYGLLDMDGFLPVEEFTA